ncbi:hypothetical protein ACFX1T_024206 [Malus domestica]
MAFWFCIFLLFAVGGSKPANPINQTDLQAPWRTTRVHPQPFNTDRIIINQASAAFSEWNSGSLKQPQQDHQHHQVQKIRPLFLNNANIVTPNVSVSSTSRCHGITTAMAFHNFHGHSGNPAHQSPCSRRVTALIYEYTCSKFSYVRINGRRSFNFCPLHEVNNATKKTIRDLILFTA